LREAQPEQANLADLEDELAQTREENVKLVQEVSQLSRRDRSETDADRETCEAELGELRRTIATLEDEVSEVREGLEKQDGELREKGEELVRAVARAERAE
jgi:chromosome segregation ATPase